MDKIRVSAKTKDEAITKALIQLSTTSDRLDYKVLVQGSNGIFGIGAKPWIIEASVKAESEDLRKLENEIKNIASGRSVTETAMSKEKRAESAGKAAAERPVSRETDAASKECTAVNAKTDPAAETKPQSERAASGKDGNGKGQEDRNQERPRRNNRRGSFSDRERNGRRPEKKFSHGGYDPVNIPALEAAPVPEKKVHPIKPVSEEEANAAIRTAEDYISAVLSGMKMEVNLKAQFNYENNELSILMEGPDMGILIGKRGQTLDAIQYLTALVVNKAHKDDYIRIKLDTEDYRKRREQTLRNLARNIAYKVKRTKRAVSLEPMNPYERRIIHSALQSDRFVATKSEGEEPFRHVIIYLKKSAGGRGYSKQRIEASDDADRKINAYANTDVNVNAESKAPVDETKASEMQQ